MIDQPEARTLHIEKVDCANSFYAYRVTGLQYPLQADVGKQLHSLMRWLAGVLGAQFALQPTLWLDMKELHRDGGSRTFSTHARQWRPELGFCFDPTLSPPRPLELSDLMDMEYGTPLRIDDRSAARIGNPKAFDGALQLMASRGMAVLLFFKTSDDAEKEAVEYAAYTRDHLQKLMSPGKFQHFDYYLPLLNSQGVGSADSSAVESWLGPIQVYMREAEEKQELFLLSRHDMDLLLLHGAIEEPKVQDMVWE